MGAGVTRAGHAGCGFRVGHGRIPMDSSAECLVPCSLGCSHLIQHLTQLHATSHARVLTPPARVTGPHPPCCRHRQALPELLRDKGHEGVQQAQPRLERHPQRITGGLLDGHLQRQGSPPGPGSGPNLVGQPSSTTGAGRTPGQFTVGRQASRVMQRTTAARHSLHGLVAMQITCEFGPWGVPGSRSVAPAHPGP